MRLRDDLVSLNTHAVGWTGVVLVFVGTFGPLAVRHWFPGEPSLGDAAEQFCKFLITVGAGAAFIGRAPQIPK